MTLRGIFQILSSQFLHPPLTILCHKRRIQGTVRCLVSPLSGLLTLCVLVDWLRMMHKYALSWPRIISHSTIMILGSISRTFCRTICIVVLVCTPLLDFCLIGLVWLHDLWFHTCALFVGTNFSSWLFHRVRHVSFYSLHRILSQTCPILCDYPYFYWLYRPLWRSLCWQIPAGAYIDVLTGTLHPMCRLKFFHVFAAHWTFGRLYIFKQVAWDPIWLDLSRWFKG